MAFTTRNNATSLLAGSLSAGATSLSVTPGEGAKFPNPTAGDWFPLTLAKANGSLEIVRATARSGDVITITRAQEGTAAQAFSAGDRVELRMTSAVFTELQTKTAEALTAAGSAQTSANSAQTSANNAQTSVDNLNTVTVKRDSATGAATLPGGTTAQRPASPTVGMNRYNSDLGEHERYQGGKWLPFNSFDKAINEAPIVTLASAATVDIGAAASNTISITGTTTITSLGTAPSGVTRRLYFSGVLTLTHSTSIILPGRSNIVTEVGDIAEFFSAGGGVWGCISYTRINGQAVVGDNPKQLCTAWVNFNGTGSIAIRDGYNVSSLVDNGTGLYGINFTTAMTNANYCAVGSAVLTLGSQQNSVAWISPYNPSTTSLQLSASASSSGLNDMAVVNVAIFGGR